MIFMGREGAKPRIYHHSAYLSAVQLADHILFFLLGVLLPAVLFVTGRKRATAERPPRFDRGLKIRLYYGNGTLLYSLAVMVLTVWYFSDRPFTGLGLGWGRMPYDIWAVALLGGFMALYLLDLYLEVGSPDRRAETREQFLRLGFLPASGYEYLHWLFLATAAGIGEEIVYRGFMISYLSEVLPQNGGGTVLTLLIPAASFGLGHVYQGGRAVVKVAVMALIFGFFFYRTGTLWPLILLHAGVDVVAGLLSWYLLGREEEVIF